MFHVTERLLLRPVWPEDWAEVLAGIGEEAIVRNLARAPWPYGEDDARRWTRQPQDPCAPSFGVVESRTDATARMPDFTGVNSLQLYRDDDGWKIVSLYYHVGPADLPIPGAEAVSGRCLD